MDGSLNSEKTIIKKFNLRNKESLGLSTGTFKKV
jgi:hypothetical protein